MKFEDSGLPADPSVKEAFDYAFAKFKAEHRSKAKAAFTQQLNEHFDSALTKLKIIFDSEKITKEKYNEKKQEIEKIRALNLSKADEIIDKNMSLFFQKHIVKRTKEMIATSSLAPVIISLLADAMRSAKDYLEVEKKFGKPMATLLAELQHMHLYPDEANAMLAQSEPLVKAVFMAHTTYEMEETQKRLQRMFPKGLPPGAQLDFESAERLFNVEVLFGHLEATHGTDEKLEKRLTTAFNAVAKILQSPYRIEKDASGKPILIKDDSDKKPPSDDNDPKKKPPSKKDKKDNGIDFGDLS